MQDPEAITLTQIQAALTAMGIDPEVKYMREVRIDPREVTITRFQTSESGSNMLSADRRGILTETTSIRVVRQ